MYMKGIFSLQLILLYTLNCKKDIQFLKKFKKILIV